MKQRLIEFLKGMIIGIINIIPGFSTSTMAVILDVYDKCINAFSSLIAHPKKAIKEIWAMFLGLVVGIGISVYLIATLLDIAPIITTLFFVGLIIGSIPKQVMKLRGKHIRIKHVIAFLISFAVLIAFPLLKTEQVSFDDFQFTFLNGLLLFIVGVVGAVSLVMGASGTIVLMGLGYYELTVMLAKSVFDYALMGDPLQSLIQFLYLLPFAVGTILGASLCSSMMKKLIENQHMTINYIVLGLITAAPLIVMYKLFEGNSNLTDTNQTINWIIGAVFLLIGAFISIMVIFLDKRRLAKKQLVLENTSEESIVIDEPDNEGEKDE